MAISDAVRTLSEDIDEGYTSLPVPAAVFQQWFRSYLDEFRRCYAGMSMVDLTNSSVLFDGCCSMDLMNSCLD